MHIQPSPTEIFFHLAKRVEIILKTTKYFSFQSAIEMRRTMQAAKDLSALCWYIPELSFCIDMESKMAKQSRDFNLIDYRLSDAELDQFEAWSKKNPPSFPVVMADLAAMNYKTSLTFVENSESWCVSITGKEDAKFNAKATITTWADDVEEALLMAYFKVIVVFSKGKWQAKERSNRG